MMFKPNISFIALVTVALSITRLGAESQIEIPLLHGTTGDKSSLFVHLASPDHRTGTAIIICPGGGYGLVSIVNEGHDVAKWFAKRGVTGIVLKYRLPAKPGNGTTAPFDDAYEAIREVRNHAQEWGVDTHRVGIMGFSAGGHVASTVGTHFDAQTRPDFLMLIYPVITMGELTHGGSRLALLGANPDPALVKFYSNELHVTRDTPPTFLAQSSDDRAVNVRNSVDFYLALRQNGVAAELHIYEVGDHGMKGGVGYGIGGECRTVSGTWPQRAMDWMGQRGLLGPIPSHYQN